MSSEQKDTLKIGQPGQQWKYSFNTQGFDLSPTSSKGYTFNASVGNVGSIRINPSETAFIIVDMQNFFLDPSFTKHEAGLRAVEPTLNVLTTFRKVGIQVIWLNWGLTDEDLRTAPPAVLRSFMTGRDGDLHPGLGLGVDLGGNRGRCLIKDTWNSDIYPALKAHAQPSDIYCDKNRISGLWTPKQPLWKILKERGLNTLFFGGVNTDVCVLSTIIDGYNNGWNCIAIEDCCGSVTDIYHKVGIDKISNIYGFVTNSAKIISGE